MFTDSQTTLYIVLTISIALLTVFICVTLIYLILILRDASKTIEQIRDTADKVNSFVLKPVSLISSVVDHIKPLLESALERRMEQSRRKKG
ncbi:MAG: hypothetical protein AAB606_03035 [Patescibacteria group bacterium]